MNEIITRCLEEDNAMILAEFPEELMNVHEKETVQFVLAYRHKYGKMPTLGRVMDSVEIFIPFEFTPSTYEPEPAPIGDVFDQTIRRKLLYFTQRELRDLSAYMKAEGEVDLGALAEIERVHTLSLGVVKYSKFDRDSYFRRVALNLPFKILNRAIGGIGNGDFMLLAARLGKGKSTLAQFIAKDAWENNKTVLFISAEMLHTDVFSRIDAMVGEFNPWDLRGKKTDEISDKLEEVFAKVSAHGGEIIVPRRRLITPQQIATFAKNLKADLIIVDGAYLLNPSSGRYTSKWEKVSTVSNELKQIALDLNLPIVGTVQIKRGADPSDGYTAEDLALSDSLGQDADFIVTVVSDPVVKNRAVMSLIKNRYGSLAETQIFIDFDKMDVIEETVKGATEKVEAVTVTTWDGEIWDD